MTDLEKSQHDLLLRCRVILQELVEAEPSLVYTSREQAILEEMEEVWAEMDSNHAGDREVV